MTRAYKASLIIAITAVFAVMAITVFIDTARGLPNPNIQATHQKA